MKSSNKITIIGGGPAGLSCALYSKKNNLDFILFESQESFGGNCRTIKHNDFYFDTGAHRLHDKDPETTRIIKKILGDRLFMINVPSQIYRNNSFIDFPLSPYGIFKFLGLRSFLTESLIIFLNSLRNNKKSENFYQFSINRFGSKISKLFLLDYSEKLWGLESNKLSKKISGNRLKGFSIYTMILEFIFGNKIKTKHLDGSFYYPDFGIGVIFDEIVSYCGTKNFKNLSLITSINHSNFKIDSIEINQTSKESVDELISTIPLGLFLNLLNPPPPKKILQIASSIRFRNMVLFCFFLNKKNINNNGSMYFPDKKYPFTRVYEPMNRSKHMSPKNKTSLIVEVPCQKGDDYWEKSSLYIDSIKLDLEKIGFFTANEVIEIKTFKIHNAYPILENGFEKKIKTISSYLEHFTNLQTSGRNALFEYSHIHDHMKNASEIINSLKLKY